MPGNVGFVVDKQTLGQVFSEYFGFPCQFTFHRLLHNHRHHHLSSGARTVDQTMEAVLSGLKSHPIRKIHRKKVGLHIELRRFILKNY
jgi:hypothetical protein